MKVYLQLVGGGGGKGGAGEASQSRESYRAISVAPLFMMAYTLSTVIRTLVAPATGSKRCRYVQSSTLAVRSMSSTWRVAILAAPLWLKIVKSSCNPLLDSAEVSH